MALPKGVKRLPSGKLQYRGETFAGFNKPKPSNKKGKKRMVLAKEGDKAALVHYGAKGYSDFTKHKDPKRRASYRARAGGVKDKSGKPAIKNKLSPAYWAYHDLW